jgi:hypothetical protein
MYKDRGINRIACGNIERRVCSADVYDGSESSRGLLVLVDGGCQARRNGRPGRFRLPIPHLSSLNLKHLLHPLDAHHFTKVSQRRTEGIQS